MPDWGWRSRLCLPEHHRMKKSLLLALLTLGSIISVPTMAMAHQIAGRGGFITGVRHPVLGFDHLLAMLSVGLLSAQMGGQAIWTVPLTFVGVMLVGGILGMVGVPLISVELGIALSVLLLGMAIASEKKLPVVMVMAFVGFFALFHGHAHGTEMPHLANPIPYALGFVVGTAAIHIAGVVLGLVAERFQHGDQVLCYAGSGIAWAGIYLIVRQVML